MNIENNDSVKIDENLYSRQLGAFGLETMTKLVKMRVLTIGVSGVGLETLKNLILAGPASVTIYDPNQVSESDREVNYYISDNDLLEGKSRAEATIPHLSELNSYVTITELRISEIREILSFDLLKNFDVLLLCDLLPYEFVTELNENCRISGIGFVMGVTKGFFGMVFDDFGENHTVFDSNGEQLKSVLVSMIELDGTVTTQEDKRHNLEEGEFITFKEVVGLEGINGVQFRVEKVMTPFTFSIGDISAICKGQYKRNGQVEEVKMKKVVKHKSLKESLNYTEQELIDCDMNFDFLDRIAFYKWLFCCYWSFFQGQQENEDVDFEKASQFESFLYEKLLSLDTAEEWKKRIDQGLARQFFIFSHFKYLSVDSFFGGIIAQEIIKKTGKFEPLNQFFIHEFYSNLFPTPDISLLLSNIKESRGKQYKSQIVLLGEDKFRKMQNCKVLMVGAGALGCEYLKLFSKMGLSSAEGVLTVTDDDQIEVSNLNRQFLFRAHHVGKSKSSSAVEVVSKMNPRMKLNPLKSRVAPDTEKLFNDAFWDSQMFVVNAVDNIKAREYIDRKVVLHKKPLFEAGTLGTKCNSQVIIPNLTESYNDSVDPPEKSIPMCTLKSFPYLIEHTIEWARGLFFSLFVDTSRFLAEAQKDHLKSIQGIEYRLKHSPDEMKMLDESFNLLASVLNDPSLKSFIHFSKSLYELHFELGIKKLLELFPEDYRDKEGNLFWTSPKRAPKPLSFNLDREECRVFIKSSVNILFQIFDLKKKIIPSDLDIENALKDYKCPLKNIKLKDKDLKEGAEREKEVSPISENELEELKTRLIEIVDKAKSLKNRVNISELEFEKDDDENGHIDFINSISNFRAENYSIPTSDRFQTKMTAGKIIPAIATSTAIVVGNIGIEIYKYFLDVSISNFRNFFSNLAGNNYIFSEPFPPKVQKDTEFDVILQGPVKAIPENWNTWSRLEVKGPLKLKEVIENIRKEYNFTISTMAIEGKTLYTDYIQSLAGRLELEMEEIFKQMELDYYPGKRYQVISVSGETENMEDVVCPYLVYHFASK